MCISSIYLKTDNVIFQGKQHINYTLYAGIKQGPLISTLISTLISILFVFYVNDIFDFFKAVYCNPINSIYELVHVLMHADDAAVIASSRELMVRKMRSMQQYCNLNSIIPQYTKCEFIVINGNAADIEPLPFGDKLLNNVSYITLLGSHLSSKGTLSEELKIHVQTRYVSCIKYYNFLRANKLAPPSVKIKVLKACVVNSLLFNCETFGDMVPNELEKTYKKLLRCTFNVRTNTSILTLYIESGFLPIKALILSRQLKFFFRYKEGLLMQTRRVDLFNRLMEEPNAFLQH